jgi:tRNA (cmo5U34)-methyltransferase
MDPEAHDQFHFDPQTYLAMVLEEVPAYEVFQDAMASATEGRNVGAILELGVGTGETSARVLALHPGALLVGLDESEGMLEVARTRLPRADLRVRRFEDPLPEGPFDLVVSALAVHHLDDPGKVDLFERVTEVLTVGGRFVLGDVVVPEDPADRVTPIDEGFDLPSRVDRQLEWLSAAGLSPSVVWAEQDLAVIVGERV